MIQIFRKDKDKVLKAIHSRQIDTADISFPNRIDTIILSMKRQGFPAFLSDSIEDKRADNHHIPFYMLLILAVAAKMKQKTSLTDVPFAVSDAELPADSGWNVRDNERNVSDGLFRKA